ncbi:hypothetical protein JCM8202_001473 [Rhodotorula sphaerocarpa]
MSHEADAELPSTAADVAAAAPTFKRKKRPQAVRSALLNRDQSAGDASDPSTREQTPLSGFDGDVDDSTSETLEELLALRRLKRSTAGLELERLNSGERKKRPKVAKPSEDADGVTVTSNGMLEGTNGGLRAGAGDRIRDDSEGPEAKARKIIKTDNFTGQTNTVDVDKHMLAYIEAELAKKRGANEESEDGGNGEKKPYDPRDELYRVAEKYRFADIDEAEKGKKERDEEEGNVTLSASMLMGIPEVDLGIDIKLKNIEATEKAKRTLQETRKAKRDEADEFAADRFYRHRRNLESDSDALARAKAEAAAAADPSKADPDAELRNARPRGGDGRRQLATDEMALSRFKKRQQQQWGK